MDMETKHIFIAPLLILMCFLLVNPCWAQTNRLVNIKSGLFDADKSQLILDFTEQPRIGTSFSLTNPSRIVFDLPNVRSKISEEEINNFSNLGVIKAINLAENNNNLRVVIEVDQMLPYKTDISNNRLTITLDNREIPKAFNTGMVQGIDFRRGGGGEGRLIVDLDEGKMPIDFKEDQGKVRIEFKKTGISGHLTRKFDVRDFGTPIEEVKVTREKGNVIMDLATVGSFEKIAYQIDNQYIFEARPVSEQEKTALHAKKFRFTGDKISLNFQDIAVRSVLQILADFTGLNIVASDSVSGSMTLKLNNVPWDQALDFILKSKGLGRRDSGNIVLIAPNEELVAREQLELEALQQNETLAPLRTEFIQVNFAQATILAELLKSEENSILSSRGQISVDERTNVLLVKDTFEKILEVKDILAKLDIPVKQVLIESQIVETSDTFTDTFGLALGGAAKMQLGKYKLGIGGSPASSSSQEQVGSTDQTAESTSKVTPAADTAIALAGAGTTNRGIFSNLASTAVTNSSGAFGFALSKLPGGTLLDLELRAAEAESKSKTISRPRLVTQDQQTATIEQGNEIPYATSSQNGTNITFKKATLKLEVTPQITANNKISLTLNINQDKPGTVYSGQTGIDTVNSSTTVLIDNGETIVLGGVFKDSQSSTNERIPYLNKIPLIGRLFRADNGIVSRKEVLIFVTPRILQEILDSKHTTVSRFS